MAMCSGILFISKLFISYFLIKSSYSSLLHVCNTGILIWFIPQLEKVVCKLIKPKADKEDEDFRLRFIQAGIMKTPELSVFEAQQEIGSFGERIHRMFGMVRELLETQDSKTFDKLYERIEKYEGISDNMEIEIAKYLDQVSDAHLSDDTKAKIRAMLREISEIESIGDSCFNLARTIKRSVKENGVTVVSVFLNPTQFNDQGDLDRYPRTLDADCKLLEACGADYVFAPSVKEM